MPPVSHVVSDRDWPSATAVYRGGTMDTHGFIHCSTADQLIPVANRFFRGRREVRALDIDENSCPLGNHP